MNAQVDISVFVPPDVLALEQLMLGELHRGMRGVVDKTANKVRANITEPDDAGRVIHNTHELLKSVDTDVDETEQMIEGRVFSDVEHAEWVEEGRPPGPVAVEIIIEWMLDKGIQPREGETLEQSAHLIARKIRREGYEGRYPFARALDGADDLLTEAIHAATERLNRRLSS